jgi:hypothetical protein
VPASYSLPATSLTSLRAGLSLGDWQVSAFVDNVFDAHTIVNYTMGQTDTYAAGLGVTPPTTQQNVYSLHPRTVGLTATWRLGH